MKQEELKNIIEKSKTKKNGIYSYNRINYAVKNYKPVLFSYDGSIKQFFSGFLVNRGKVEVYNQKTELKRLLKEL